MIAPVTRPRTLDANRCCATPSVRSRAAPALAEPASGPIPLAHADKIAARLGSPRPECGAWLAVHTAAFVPSSAPVAAGRSALTRRLDGGGRVVEPDYYAAPRNLEARVESSLRDNGPSTTVPIVAALDSTSNRARGALGNSERRVRRRALSPCRRSATCSQLSAANAAGLVCARSPECSRRHRRRLRRSRHPAGLPERSARRPRPSCGCTVRSTRRRSRSCSTCGRHRSWEPLQRPRSYAATAGATRSPRYFRVAARRPGWPPCRIPSRRGRGAAARSTAGE